MGHEMEKDGPLGGEFDESGNFRNQETREGGPKIESLETVSREGLVRTERRSDQEGRPLYEYKRCYLDQEAQGRGEIIWGNENHYEYDEQGRQTMVRKVGFKDEDMFQREGKMDWGHETRFTYNEQKNSVLAESRNLNKEGAWREETTHDAAGRKTERAGEVTEGPEKGKKWVKKYSYREGEIEHAGQKYKGLIETEDGEEETPDGGKKTWRKIVVYNEKKEHIAHWRTDE